jgi:hypothetical protein
MSMNWRRMGYVFGFLALATVSGGKPALADPQHYTAREFMALTDNQRQSFYSGAFMMMGHVVSQHDQKTAECVWKWYFDNPDERIDFLDKSLREYSEYSPTAIFIGLVQKDCGKF